MILPEPLYLVIKCLSQLFSSFDKYIKGRKPFSASLQDTVDGYITFHKPFKRYLPNYSNLHRPYMLLIDIVANYFPAYKEALIFQKEFLLNVQNAYASVMLMCLMTQLCHCTFYDECVDLVLFPITFNYYIVADLLLCEPDIYIHHILSFIILYIYNSNIEIIGQIYSVAIAFGMTEISTVFLTIRAVLKNYKRRHPYITMVYNVNDIIFAITFFYTRVYLYYFNLLHNQDMYIATRQFTLIEYHFFNQCLYLLYFLNLYWAYLIMKTIVKSVNCIKA